MAQTVHLNLTIDGNDVEGESTIASFDREGTIECDSFDHAITTPRDEHFQLIGRRQHKPVRILKRIDKSTPLLLKALCENELVNAARFRFFRPSPGGAGTEEHFYTVVGNVGYISGVKQLSETMMIGGEEAPPMMEEVEFVFQTITWTYEINGATHRDVLR